MEVATPWGLFHWGETNGVFTFLSLLYAIPRKSQALRGKFTKTLSLCSRALLFPKSKNFQRPAWACPARQWCFAPGLRLPASASLSLASCWPRPQQLLPVSAAGARVAFAAFLRPLGRGLEKQKAAPASPPFICRWQRSAPLRSSPLPQKVRVLSAKAGENGMPFGKFAKERSNCL